MEQRAKKSGSQAGDPLIEAKDLPVPNAQPPTESAPPGVKPVSKVGGGMPAVLSAAKYTFKEMGLVRGTRTLLQLNQKQGIDCPGCAWTRDGSCGSVERSTSLSAIVILLASDLIV